MKEYSERVSKIPTHLRIRILFDDEDVVVIDKPCNLRSVPGHATNPPSLPQSPQQQDYTNDKVSRKRPYDSSTRQSDTSNVNNDDEESRQRRTGQEAWTLAIQSFQAHQQEKSQEDYPFTLTCLQRLASDKKLASSVPRKYKLFHRYVVRNQKRLFPLGIPTANVKGCNKDIQQNSNSNESPSYSELLETVSKEMYSLLQERQKPLLNLPEPTKFEDSAFGQLILMGYGTEHKSFVDSNTNNNGQSSATNLLKIVHRLDCEVGTNIICESVFYHSLKYKTQVTTSHNLTLCFVFVFPNRLQV